MYNYTYIFGVKGFCSSYGWRFFFVHFWLTLKISWGKMFLCASHISSLLLMWILIGVINVQGAHVVKHLCKKPTFLLMCMVALSFDRLCEIAKLLGKFETHGFFNFIIVKLLTFEVTLKFIIFQFYNSEIVMLLNVGAYSTFLIW